MMRETQDNIISILKSIAPIKHKFSRKNKEFDKTFKNKSLETLLKNLDYHPKLHDEYAPSPEFLNHRNQYDINFQNSDNYIKEFSDLNNLPLVMNNKNCLKNGTFNPDYEINPVKNKEEQKLILLEKERRKKERLQDRLERLKKWRQSDSSLDPGKYHPNYDFIRKKITSVYIRQPIVKINKKHEEVEKNNDKNKNNNNKDKDNKKEDDKNNSNHKNSEINKSTIKDEKTNDNNKTENNNSKNGNDNKDNRNNNSTNLNDSHSLNDNSSLNNNNSSKISIIRNIKRKTGRNIKYRNSNLLEKNSSTLSDYNNTIDNNNNNKSTNIEELPSFHHLKKGKNKNLSLPKIGTRKLRNIKAIRNKKNRFRSSSLGNLKNPIIFRKMLGRDDTLFSNQNLNLISYFPNYDAMMPHIPSTIFKYKDNPQNYKKYITNKIIRGYNYTPEKYFVLEYGKNKIKKIDLYKERIKMKEILKKKVEE
jgi:hypothetical protein